MALQYRRKAESLLQELKPKPFGLYGNLWLAFLIIMTLLGLYFYMQQLRKGLSITGLNNYLIWGIYISNFVFFVAVSLVGSLISAMLKLSNVKWRIPLTRIAEIIAVSAIVLAAIVIVIDMGRPDRFTNVLFKARIQSPITWDVIVITTYLFVSILLLYLPLLPDFALMRDKLKDIPTWQKKVYRILALNWNYSEEQEKILLRAIRILAIVIIPVALAIHTVTSWLFATTLRPGWDSTNFGPYFVSGAFVVGAAAVIAAMYVFRNAYDLEKYFNNLLFDRMGKLLVLLSLVYLYFNINEYFVPAYKMKGQEAAHLGELFSGAFALEFWSVQILGMILPIILMFFRKGRKPLPMFLISILVILGAWFKRYLIVTPTLAHPYIPSESLEGYLHYNPTIPEWFITGGTLAGALLIITILVRYLPVLPIWETAKDGSVEPEMEI